MNNQIVEEKAVETARLTRVSQEIRDGKRSESVCDKCGREVESKNDATRLDFFLGNILAFLAIPRHLLPVVEDGELVCEGSPSRAQYLEGQARDKRASYPYREEYEGVIRKAYTKLILESATIEN